MTYEPDYEARQRRVERILGSLDDAGYPWTLLKALLLGMCIYFLVVFLQAERFLPAIAGLLLAGIAVLEMTSFPPDSRS